ncbi:terminase large subunit domain-containing protein [Bacillus cereus group sp. IBL03679]|uniref:terminase large subunit domain-containing protein n=1 Tax=Bacillus cereus group sp. IBL03679 TaxID=3240095 RepID=UPI003D2F68A0
MIHNQYVSEYIEMYRTGKIKLNKERIMLIEYLEKYILIRDDLYFDNEMHEDYIKFTEKWYFELQPFQKFLTAFVFLFYKEDDSVFYEQFLIMMARGGGKNGLISSLCHFFISPLHGIDRYNVSIVANNEKQAKVSFREVYDAIKGKEILEDMFYRTKVEILSNDTQSIMQYHTSNAGSKDGLRDGCVIYDEIHRYENFDVVNVFSSGLGKVPNAREFFIGTDGFVRDGFLDKTKERAMNILKGKDLEDPLFPFICKIDNPEEIDNPDVWEKANPMFSEPRSSYAKQLFKKVLTQYKQLENNPSNREEFITKRMNYHETELKKRVNTFVSYEVEAQSIGRVFGLVHELINEGDTIKIKDTGFTPKLYLEARVIAGDESFTDPTQDKYVFGDYREIIDPNEELRKLYNKILASLGNKQEILDQLDKLIKETDEKANNAQKESEAAKKLAEKVQENLQNNTVDIIESINPPTANLKPNKTLWRDISKGKPGVLKIWTGMVWEELVPDYGEDVKELDERTAEFKTSLEGLESNVGQLSITTNEQGKQRVVLIYSFLFFQ